MINLVRNARIIISILYKLTALENSWDAQWLGLQASTAGTLGSTPGSHGMAKNLVKRFNQFGAADHFCQRSFNLVTKSDIYCV